MPVLVYPTGNFVPFTKMLSSEVNGKFNSITTLLNVTKLNSVNVQTGGLLYNNMTITTSMQVVVTDVAGVMTTSAVLPAGNGGLGFAFTPTTLDALKVLQVNSAGTAFTLDTNTNPTGKVYARNHFI